MGASYFESEFDVREAGGHQHGAGKAVADNELLNGEVDVAGIDFIYKWAPQGNAKSTNLKIQAEYFVKNEAADAEFTEGSNSAQASLDGQQKGYYIQGVYQFMPAWRVGLRYDHLQAKNTITNFVDSGIDAEEFLDESSLGTAGDPNKSSVMLDYSPSHFSRIRLQYSLFDNGLKADNNIVTLQYTMSLGSHGSHTF